MIGATNVLISLISIAILWVCLFWLYRDYCVELFRQRMFALRDELFDEAVKGTIPFNHKSYGMLRVTMNGFIRFAHEVSLGHFLIAIISHKEKYPEYSERFNSLIENLNSDQRKILKSIDYRMKSLLLKHIFLSSPILVMTVIAPIVVLLLIRAFFGRLMQVFVHPIDRISDLAFACGDDFSESRICGNS